MTSKNVLVTITGPSLTGKTTLAQDLMEKNSDFHAVVTHTTRPPRQGEVNGESYHFVTKEEFIKLLGQDGFVEYAEVGPEGNTHFYGASKAAVEKVLEMNKNPLLVIEPEGAANVYKFSLENNFKIYQIFLNNPRDVLFARFLERFKNDSKASVDNYVKRLKNMLEVEPDKWINPALTGAHRYDDVAANYTENRHEVADLVINKVNALKSDSKPKLKQ